MGSRSIHDKLQHFAVLEQKLCCVVWCSPLVYFRVEVPFLFYIVSKHTYLPCTVPTAIEDQSLIPTLVSEEQDL